MFNRRQFNSESGNAALIVLAVIVVAAIGGLAYFSGKIGKEAPAADNSALAAAAAQTATAAPAAADPNAPEAKPPVLKPGNPVVAKMKGGEVTRLDVFNFIQDLPAQTRQMPLEQLYPLALEQVINSRIIAAKTKNVNLDNDEEVKKRLAAAKTEIVRGVYIEKQVNQKVSEDRLKSVYDEYVKNFPDIQGRQGPPHPRERGKQSQGSDQADRRGREL
jgi:peptidyl-prolyl cis-trans isomerase C